MIFYFGKCGRDKIGETVMTCVRNAERESG